MNYYVVGNKFHINTDDGALGLLLSTHRSLEAAEAAQQREDRHHAKECRCGGTSILADGYWVSYGKVYRGKAKAR